MLRLKSAFFFATMGFSVQQAATEPNQNLAHKCLDNTTAGVADAAFNATGTVEFTFEPIGVEPQTWYLTAALSDKRFIGATYPGSQSLSMHLSVPEAIVGSRQGNATRICPYRLSVLNATREDGEPPGSCKGILSEECLDALKAIQSPGDDECPSAGLDHACSTSFVQSKGKIFLHCMEREYSWLIICHSLQQSPIISPPRRAQAQTCHILRYLMITAFWILEDMKN